MIVAATPLVLAVVALAAVAAHSAASTVVARWVVASSIAAIAIGLAAVGWIAGRAARPFETLVHGRAQGFRTPLTSMLMAIHLCLDGSAGELSDEQQHLLLTAREECERLQAGVDELLDLARIPGGRPTIN